MTVYDQIQKNKRRTLWLMTLFIIILLAIGFFGGELWLGEGGGFAGITLAIGICAVMIPLSIYGGDSIALLTAGAQEVSFESHPEIYRLVENLCITVGMPMPQVYIMDDPMMNAFATGRNPEKAAIALTTGIIKRLDKDELEAVIAHELSHIQNYDTRVMMVVIVLVGAIALLADIMVRSRFAGRRNNNSKSNGQAQLIIMIAGIVLIALSPLFAELIKLAISRKREYLADASAVLMNRRAESLASALEKISGVNTEDMDRANTATAHMYFVSPFSAKKRKRSWMATHPPIEDRIGALREMGGITE